MTLYKLTNREGKTRAGWANETQWGENTTHTAVGPENGPLCSDSWIHAYESPEMAIIMNPAHAIIQHPILWEAEGHICLSESGLKCGCRTLTTIRETPLPNITLEQRIRFTIGCAAQVYADPSWVAWATQWVSGADRTEAAANAAEAAYAAARSVAYTAANYAAYAANFAAYAAAKAANFAAYAAANAAKAAGENVSFSRILKWALSDSEGANLDEATMEAL
jgi:hypothetical protein